VIAEINGDAAARATKMFDYSLHPGLDMHGMHGLHMGMGRGKMQFGGRALH
jgi:hypothetical protein